MPIDHRRIGDDVSVLRRGEDEEGKRRRCEEERSDGAPSIITTNEGLRPNVREL